MAQAFNTWVSDGPLEGDLEEYVDEYDGNTSEAVRELLRRGLQSSNDIDSPMLAEGAYQIEVEMSAYEARIVGNRLWKGAQHYEGHAPEVKAETEWLARRFHRMAGLR